MTAELDQIKERYDKETEERKATLDEMLKNTNENQRIIEEQEIEAVLAEKENDERERKIKSLERQLDEYNK